MDSNLELVVVLPDYSILAALLNLEVLVVPALFKLEHLQQESEEDLQSPLVMIRMQILRSTSAKLRLPRSHQSLSKQSQKKKNRKMQRHEL